MPGPAAPLSDWLAWLETLSPTEIELGLERTAAVLERLELQRPSRVLLIAGTNGKGSSVAMADALLRASGFATGAYTSPHIHRFNERILVNGVAASDADIIAAFRQVERARQDTPLTYFEFTTLAAAIVFEAAALDVWILEVGLGGRLDASNAIDPDASLITNISLDHCDWLGDDLESIGAEKAGVMRANAPTVFGDSTIPQSVLKTARERAAILLRAGIEFRHTVGERGTWNWQGPGRDIAGLQPPGLIGKFQLHNAAAVLMLLEAAGLGEKLDAGLVNRVLPGLRLGGRLQRLTTHAAGDGQRNWLVDVAHNPAAARELAQVLAADDFPAATIAIVGVLADKDLDGVIGPLVPQVDHWLAVTADSPRAIKAEELARRIANLADKACAIVDSAAAAVELAQRIATENDRIVVTGSFFTVGPILAELNGQSYT